jgi:hypothetical protein
LGIYQSAMKENKLEGGCELTKILKILANFTNGKIHNASKNTIPALFERIAAQGNYCVKLRSKGKLSSCLKRREVKMRTMGSSGSQSKHLSRVLHKDEL